MRSGAWIWLTAFGLPACSGDYPLEPTACDDYCGATKGLECAFYSPAGCVSQCERDGRGHPACHAELDAVVRCFDEKNAAAQRCIVSNYLGNFGSRPCDPELEALNQCTFVTQFETPP